MPPLLAILAVLGLLGAATAGATALRRWGCLDAEGARKLVHILLGLVVAAFPWIFHDIWPVLLLAGLALIALLGLRLQPALRSGLGAALHDVDRESWGEICFPLAAALLWCLATADPLLFSVPILVLASADAAAALVGVRYGRTELSSGTGRKSWEGAVAFAITAYMAVHIPLLLWSDLGRVECLLIAATFAVLMTAVEAVSWRGLDNLFIPLVGWLFLESWLTEPSAALAEQLAIACALCFVLLLLRRRRTLDDGALAGGMLAVFMAGSIGGWHWLGPPLLVYLAYTVVWPLPAHEQPRHHSGIMLSVVLPGLLWLMAGHHGLHWQLAFVGYTAAWCGAAACIGVASLWNQRPWITTTASAAAAGPCVALLAWALSLPHSGPMLLYLLAAAAAIPAAACFAWLRPQLNDSGGLRWTTQMFIPLCCSSLPLVAVLVSGHSGL
ncbi:MAG: hypothetical protein EA402_04855 [Planctomycetota bacterium]|nr:MAG: hypothetical protein EA402_04855 [Planctomycetota bacterium]